MGILGLVDGADKRAKKSATSIDFALAGVKIHLLFFY